MAYYKELTEERESEIIEKLAKFIVDKDLEDAAKILLQTIQPISFMGSQFALMTIGPLLTMLGGYEETAGNIVRLFEKRQNIKRILMRIEELRREKKTKEKTAKEAKESEVNKKGIKKQIYKIFRL